MPVAAKAWRLHVEALLLAQGVDGSWSYYAANDPIHGVKMRTPRTYPTGTFMGLADLLLARQALREEWAEKPERLARIDVAIAKGHAALRRHIQWVLGSPHIAGPIGTFPFYRLYALEKVCIFADLEDVGGILWYRDGARWLLDTQQEDGGWISLGGVGRPSARTVVSQSNLLHTSFALLFLLRASAA